MARRWCYVWVLLLLVLHYHNAVATGSPVLRREVTPTVTAEVTPASTTTGNGNEASTETIDDSTSTQNPRADTTTPITVTTATSFPSAINGNKPGNNSSSDAPSTITAGQLPISPRLTPGWGIAGAILLTSGATYTLVGIKNAWLHTFFSAAFLSGLSVTVLIVYVMVTPVSAAVEGAYVVAAVVAGVILGGAATIFREITEGLGCLLGGFCFAMWLLTLKAGGLLTVTPAIAIFIAIISAIGYGLYFSRHTRPFAQMVLMSFAGATVTVIGIDCFSRAGLKEFWAYIWNLNVGLFSDGTSTYPLTKGIRVEIALTVVFAIIGIISQLKLWRVIQEHRAKRAEEQAKEKQLRDEEEATLGLQIEAQNAREREQWETVYGNQAPRSSLGSRDSGLEGVEDEKEAHTNPTAARQPSSNKDSIEMTELTAPDAAVSPDPAEQPVNGLMITNPNDDMGVTIRVAKDDEPIGHIGSVPEPNEEVGIVHGVGESQPGLTLSSQIPHSPSRSPGPAITPLPFKIPDELDEDDSRSSIAADADEDDGAEVLGRKHSILSMASRLSVSSGNLLRSISHQAAPPTSPKRDMNGFEARGPSELDGSTENLVKNTVTSSDAISIAATIGGLSQDGDDDNCYNNYVTQVECPRHSVPALIVNASEVVSETHSIADNAADNDAKLRPLKYGWGLDVRPGSLTDTVATDTLNPYAVNSSSGDVSKQSTLNKDARKSDCANENDNPTQPTSESSKAPRSLAPSIASTSVSLTKDRLPSALPRVALSYRTNEWAKHLAMAEAPPLEQLHIDEYPQQQNESNIEAEIAVPVHVDELQQTAEKGVPPAVNGQSSPGTSDLPQVPPATYRSLSRISSHSLKAQGESPDPGALANTVKTTIPNQPQAGHSFRNKGPRRSCEVYTQPIQEEGNEFGQTGQPALNGSGDSTPNSIAHSPSPVPGVISYGSPQTLLGKREMLLRSRSQPQQLGIVPIQENSHYTTRSASQMMSPYNYASTQSLMTEDADDIPLSQRKQLMRQSSILSAHGLGGHSPQNGALSPTPRSISNPIAQAQPITAEPINSDSHHPDRRSTIQPHAERDGRFSHFRQSGGLRAATPAIAASGRETPLVLSAGSPHLLRNADVDRAIEQQRTLLMTQREQEAYKRESERWEKERNERTFEEMMRRGDLMDAHREALRRMQGGVKQA
ncbi:hypothetical protein GGS21DRAFT_512135 [Xylaria nigripes]|nr:hypothetical protein GGS21DRAFT_512135 [Xylaria nigripes]